MTRSSATAIRDAVAEHGTPFYLTDLDRVRERSRTFRRRFAAVANRTECLFSLKTNYLPDVIAELVCDGWGVDVVSGYELEHALTVGVPPGQIVFNGPFKRPDELALAVERGVLVNTDSLEEIAELSRLGAETGCRVPLGIRVQSAKSVYDEARPKRSHASKFGWPLWDGTADDVVGRVLGDDHLELTSIHAHLGSQITDLAAYRAAMGEVTRWVSGLRTTAPLRIFNVGGGFPVPGIVRHATASAGLSTVSGPDEASPVARVDEQQIIDVLAEVVAAAGLRGLTLVAEPGRAIVSDSTALVATVATVKRFREERPWVILDAGLNQLPTAGVAETHDIWLLERPGDADSMRYALAGPLCYEGDVFSLGVDLPSALDVGDVVVIEDAGAYGLTRATSFNQLRAPVVVVHGEAIRLAWRRESLDDAFVCATTGDASVPVSS